MLFQVSFQLHEGFNHDVIRHFAAMTPEEDEALMGDNLKLVGRWHNLVNGSGVAIFETDDIKAITAYAMGWNQFMDLDISPVVDDETGREIGKNLPKEEAVSYTHLTLPTKA